MDGGVSLASDASSGRLVAHYARKAATARRSRKSPMVTILYLTVNGYSKLRLNEQYGFFFSSTLPGISKQIDPYAPTLKQSWADAIIAVFDDHYRAARCALDVRDYFYKTNWRPIGFRLEPQIALHTGAVFRARDPLVDTERVAGTAFELCKSISGVARPGDVVVSGAFATLLRATLEDESDTTITISPATVSRKAAESGLGEVARIQRTNETSSIGTGGYGPLHATDNDLKSLGMDVGARSGSIRLLDPTTDDKFTFFASAFGPGSDHIKLDRIPADKGIAASVIKLRRSRVSHDLSSNRQFDPSTAKKAGIPPGNMITVPIIWQTKVLGVVQLINKDDDFTDADVRRTEDFARRQAPVLAEFLALRADGEKHDEFPEGLRECTVMFTDITSSGQLMREFDARGELDIYTRLLDEYLENIGRLTRQHQCWVDKFMGDGVMILANAPFEISGSAEAAVKLALDITSRTREILDRMLVYPERKIPPH